MRIRSVLKHSAQALAEGSLIALLVVGLMAGSVFAAKGGGGKPGGGATTGGGTLTGPVMVADADADGAVSYLDDITFNVSTSATAYPQVGLRCYQGTTFVYDAYVGYWATYQWDRFFRLESGYWNPNLAANCTARLFYNDSRGRQHVLATLDFGVAP
jgi:hypothetical protein